MKNTLLLLALLFVGSAFAQPRVGNEWTTNGYTAQTNKILNIATNNPYVVTFGNYRDNLYTNGVGTVTARVFGPGYSTISAQQPYTSIVGGLSNKISVGIPGTGYNFIGGGAGNDIQVSEWSVIGGGLGNVINAGVGVAIFSGNNNYSEGTWSCLLGGNGNYFSGGWAGSLLGGESNNITANGDAHVIGSRNYMDIFDGVQGAVVVGSTNKIASSGSGIFGYGLTNLTPNTVDVGVNNATKTTFNSAGVIFRGTLTMYGKTGISFILTNGITGVQTNYTYFTNGIAFTNIAGASWVAWP